MIPIFAVLALIAFARSRRRRRRVIRVLPDAFVLEDYAAWFERVPSAIRAAIEGGARGAEEITAAAMRSVAPELRWPPREDSPHAAQWSAMRQAVAAHLRHDPEPRPRHLRAI